MPNSDVALYPLYAISDIEAVAELTWVCLELLTKSGDPRPNAGLAEDTDGVGGRSTQTSHSVQDALR